MDTYHVVLYIHLLALFIGVGGGAVIVTCLFQLRKAQTVEEAAGWGRVAGKTGKIFPIAILGLFGSGAYMTTDLWNWHTGWIDASMAGLALLAVQGPLLGERMGKKLEHALRANGPGALGEAARRVTRHRLLWISELSALGVVFGIVWNMTQKPGVATAIAAIVGGYAVGTALALRFATAPVEELVTVNEPAA